MNELLQGLVDEDDADERGEGLLREACDVTDEWAGVSGHQQQTEERRPQPDTRPEGQVRQPVFPANTDTVSLDWTLTQSEGCTGLIYSELLDSLERDCKSEGTQALLRGF